MTSPATTPILPGELLGQDSRDSTEDFDPAPDPLLGDRGAWLQSILNRFESQLLRYALRITRDLELARDVVQETMLRACRENPAELDGHLGPWLFRVCRSRALDAHRKEQRMSIATDHDLQTLPAGHDPPDVLAAHETNSKILVLLETLPANQQEVIRLKFQNDLSYREIAEITGLSISNVGVQLHDGLKQLRRKMKDD